MLYIFLKIREKFGLVYTIDCENTFYMEVGYFQIICKIPYPYLGDKLIRKKMNKWKWWYPLQTAKTIVQGTGRSVRSLDDTAVTYILDSDWEMFYNRNRNIFPDSFKESLK